MYALDDTIVAVASPPGGAARGVVRLSGPNLKSVLEQCFLPQPLRQLASLFTPTVLSGSVGLLKSSSRLPCDLYLWPSKRSYTGQPAAEFHTFGSPPLLESVVRVSCAGGARLAEPGEFTLRAFLAGRIDLTQAEAVLGVIDAAGSKELDAALSQLAGGLAAPLHGLRNDLLELLAHVEAGFDFADEDLPFITRMELLRQLDSAAGKVGELVNKLALRGAAAMRVRAVLVGRPNAGKSSLFNALSGRVGAIVSDQPGTTRDYITAELDLDGVKCQLIDTAGLGGEGLASEDAEIQAAAQTQSHAQLRAAEIRLVCVPAGECGGIDSETVHQRTESWEETGNAPQRIVVRTKCDRYGTQSSGGTSLDTSAISGAGIARLKEAIRAAALQSADAGTEIVVGTAVRCGESLRLAAAALDRAREAVRTNLGEELIAAEIRIALNELGKVAGTVYTEDVLDRIFSRFCIGK
jgi:tRNA modification GTPase